MSQAHPCLSCGACCAHFRVSFYWGECVSGGGLVPDERVVQVTPSRVAMLGTESRPSRCISLSGEVGKAVSCSMYAERSSTCREFEAAWEFGQPSESCDKARAAYGLAALEPGWNAGL
ncbi:YkgJ family cysteine cluster protein [Pseudomonas sp. HR96]|uniref:YkgJ family cysteine cluster protein n=1 Tax=Pseudomonas sp. HR96 TaxID=1027966 RepID=UPI002A76116D|nr:YkgJ family cysteine cluster protein [Pseudomonas sp. HR96]WPP01789.1 YkgJ family cysteine cluster protein [Pseudomonas sp. HR96]